MANIFKSIQNLFRREDTLEHSNIRSFDTNDPSRSYGSNIDIGYSNRGGNNRRMYLNDRSIIPSIYNKIALEASQYDIREVRMDDFGHIKHILDEQDSSFNFLLGGKVNIDQTGRAFMQDVILTMFDKGHVAIVAVETTNDINKTDSYSINELRVGYVTKWFSEHVLVSVYDYITQKDREVKLPKSDVAIIYNPFYEVMNDFNSTAARISRKLTILDALDETSVSGKLDIIISLPYAVKGELRQAQAEKRKRLIEDQLKNSKYGIAYIDSTEKVTQLNRAANNNITEQISQLTSMLFGQLNMTENIFKGTATEEEQLNWFVGTIEPLLKAIVEGCTVTFVSKTARTQRKAIRYIPQPFRYVTASQFGNMIDTLSRNEHITTNEVRFKLGYAALSDDKYNKPRNPNMPSEQGDTQDQNGGLL